MVKKVLSIILWVVTGAALIALFVFGHKWYMETSLKGVSCTIERSRANGFVEEDSIIAHAKVICNTEHQAAISTVDMMKIKSMLEGNPWIAQSSAYIRLDDTLHIRIREYEPLLRVYNHDGSSVYLTHEGNIIPSSPHFTPHLIIASGHYNFARPSKNAKVSDSLYLQSGLAEALAIAKAIGKDQYLKDHIGQIYKNNDNEYEIIVNNLPVQVILGDTCAVENKLYRLKVLLEKYHGTVELEAYKTMNLKYKNQIVCTKK